MSWDGRIYQHSPHNYCSCGSLYISYSSCLSRVSFSIHEDREECMRVTYSCGNLRNRSSYCTNGTRYNWRMKCSYDTWCSLEHAMSIMRTVGLVDDDVRTFAVVAAVALSKRSAKHIEQHEEMTHSLRNFCNWYCFHLRRSHRRPCRRRRC